MQKVNFDADWIFTLKGHGARPVHLPHDFSIELPRVPDSRMQRDGGFFQGGEATYRKTFFVPEAWRQGKVLLELEGSYGYTEVTVEGGDLVACNPYGYSSFHADLSAHLQYGAENTLVIDVRNNALPNSRWYSGSGLYRHVWLLTTAGAPYLQPWGVFVTTPLVSAERAELAITTATDGGPAVLRSTALDATGRTVATVDTAAQDGETRQALTISTPTCWSLTQPYLYALRSELLVDGAVCDTVETPFGIRTIALDPARGLLLNGDVVKLKGGCVHHDCGLLGSAAYDRAEARKVEVLKAAGFNAIRTAHNPPSPAFLGACDRMGMLVIEEAFDCWNMAKTAYDYHLFFGQYWRQDLQAMVVRDRNHPSIIFWSTGNEIAERGGATDGFRVAAELAEVTRALDPTRFVTNALCDNLGLKDKDWGAVTAPYAAPLDVVGYNYLYPRYERDLETFPHRYIMGTESAPQQACEHWRLVEQHPRVLGDFVWTSMDYLGEAGIGRAYRPGELSGTHDAHYPWHQANCGDIDICGRLRPQAYYRMVLWGDRTQPYIAVNRPNDKGEKLAFNFWGWSDVINGWSFPSCEGYKTYIDVYSPCEEVELLLNGASLGRQPAGTAHRYTASFETTYEPGELKAIGYTAGQPVNEQVLHTSGAPAAVALSVDRDTLDAAYGDLAFVTATIIDANGQWVPYATNQLYFTTHGAGDIAAVGTNNGVSEEMFVGNTRQAYEGLCTIVLRSNGQRGEIELFAAADGLIPARLVVRTM